MMTDDVALPKPPSEVVATELTATSVKLMWSPASQSGAATGSPSSSTSPSYVVQYVEKSSPASGGTEPRGAGDTVREVTDISTTHYTVTGLRAHTRYEFRVIAANALGRGTPSSPLDVTTAQHGQPSFIVSHRSFFDNNLFFLEFVTCSQ